MQLKLAIPKGRLSAGTSALLQKAGVGLDEYQGRERTYRLSSTRFPYLSARVFQEKDIPIQVAVGNYDLGICGLDWIEELSVKYPTSALVKVRNLGYGRGNLYVAASRWGGISTLDELGKRQDTVRLAGEYPNLAEFFALKFRLRRFKVFPLWGAAEVYPPESADLVLLSETTEERLLSQGLAPLSTILDASAFLVASRNSWETKDMSEVVASLCGVTLGSEGAPSAAAAPPFPGLPLEEAEDLVRLALPDGHQQQPTLQFLSQAGLKIRDYPSPSGNRRPTVDLDGIAVKVIRPQDMPLQVANGNFDLAITGRDWLLDHLYRFPSSPAEELLSLGYGMVKIVAAVSEDLPVSDIFELRELVEAGQLSPLRVASEYVHIADKYARDNHLGRYRVIPTWGASEAFLPDDADLLIENTQTGETLARHNLRVIDTLFESSASLIGGADTGRHPGKEEKIKSIIAILRAAVGGV